ncbi:MAG: hypothetical protein AAF922_15790 [Pseudomonadota bacterium]
MTRARVTGADLRPSGLSLVAPLFRETDGAAHRRVAPTARRFGCALRTALMVRGSGRDKARLLKIQIAAPRPVDARLFECGFVPHCRLLNWLPRCGCSECPQCGRRTQHRDSG